MLGKKLIFKQENDFLERIDERKEELGWMELGMKSMIEMWDNEEDERIWKKYL